eukprot:g14215.t1
MTASEPLSLEEEYAMQISWKEDPKKCTFIVLSLEDEAGGVKEDEGEGGQEHATAAAATSVMAGDVNLFFNDYDDPGMCEVEVMIAEERCRRRGLAKEAVMMLMRYAVDHLGATTFYCKIGDANAPSRALFEKLGYSKHAYVEAFKETELRFEVGGGEGTAAAAALAALRTQTDHAQTVPCPAPTEVAETTVEEEG